MREINFNDWSSASKIDPLLLELLQEKANRRPEVGDPEPRQQSFAGLTAVFIGVAVMTLVILLGLLRSQETNEILANACFGLLLFCGIGFVFGKMMDVLLRESSKSMIREMIERTEPLTAENDRIPAA